MITEKPRPESERLYKITEVLDLLQNKFKFSYIPKDMLVCIDESNIPFRGWLSLGQYIPNKWHRYGIKVCKHYVASRYTCAFKVNANKEKTEDMAILEKM